MTRGPTRSVAVVFNPLSGRGKGAAAAEALGIKLARAGAGIGASGFDVRVSPLPKPSLTGDFEEVSRLVKGSDVCIVLGGDGTVRATLPALAAQGIPMLTLGMGTENLFAKHFDMPRGLGEESFSHIERILRHGSIVEIDLARVRVHEHDAGTKDEGKEETQQTCFSLMASMGPDSSIVRRLSANRKGPIGHWSYLGPIIREMLEGYLPRCTVDVTTQEGIRTRLIDNQRGFVIVANSEHYALGLNPVPRADMTDGLLEVGFFPAEGILQAAGWYAKFFLGLDVLARASSAAIGEGYVHGKGREIHVRLEHAGSKKRIDSTAPAHTRISGQQHSLQLDGDAISLSHGDVFEADFSMCQYRVKVMRVGDDFHR